MLKLGAAELVITIKSNKRYFVIALTELVLIIKTNKRPFVRSLAEPMLIRKTLENFFFFFVSGSKELVFIIKT